MAKHLHHFDDTDRQRLHEAAQLVSDVLDAKPAEMTLPVMAFLTNAVNELRLAERYLGATT